jgi:hypothetical protein
MENVMKDSVENIERFMKAHGLGFWSNDEMYRIIRQNPRKLRSNPERKPLIYVGKVVDGEVDLSNAPKEWIPIPAWLVPEDFDFRSYEY